MKAMASLLLSFALGVCFSGMALFTGVGMGFTFLAYIIGGTLGLIAALVVPTKTEKASGSERTPYRLSSSGLISLVGTAEPRSDWSQIGEQLVTNKQKILATWFNLPLYRIQFEYK